MHRLDPYDAIVVSGGALIHFRSIMQRLNTNDNAFVDYPIFESWIVPSLLAKEAGITLLWNCPGVPYDFTPSEIPLVSALTQSVDFLSVRNSNSYNLIKDCLSPKQTVTVCPDPAFLLPRYFPAEQLAQIRRQNLKLEGSYIVFHTHRLIPEGMLKQTLQALDDLQKRGERIVLLPLAYTHADDEICIELKKQLDSNMTIVFDRKLSLEEMMAVLSGCKLYIGVSFHGAITAFSYGCKVLALDFFHYRKTEALYQTMHEEENYLLDANLLYDRAIDLLASPARSPLLLKQIQRQIDAMYKAMRACLTSTKDKPGSVDSLYDYISLLHTHSSALNDHRLHMKWQSDNSDWYLNSLNQYIEGFRGQMANLRTYLSGLKEAADQIKR